MFVQGFQHPAIRPGQRLSPDREATRCQQPPATAGDPDTDPEIIRLAQLVETSQGEIEVRRAQIMAEAEAKISVAQTSRKRRASMFPDHFNLRLRVGDRARFDDYAYRQRMMKGEVFGRMLDAIETLERAEKASQE